MPPPRSTPCPSRPEPRRSPAACVDPRQAPAHEEADRQQRDVEPCLRRTETRPWPVLLDDRRRHEDADHCHDVQDHVDRDVCGLAARRDAQITEFSRVTFVPCIASGGHDLPLWRVESCVIPVVVSTRQAIRRNSASSMVSRYVVRMFNRRVVTLALVVAGMISIVLVPLWMILAREPDDPSAATTNLTPTGAEIFVGGLSVIV